MTHVLIDGVKYIPAPEIPEGNNFEAALAVRFDSDAGDDLTVRDYLRQLLLTLWDENESFSGKRPFGNSGWKYDLYKPLLKAGFVPGEIEEFEDGEFDIVEIDKNIAHATVCDLILYLFNGSGE